MKALIIVIASAVLLLPALAIDEPKAPTADSPVSFVLGPGQATATPGKDGSSRTGGGNITVSQPSGDTLSVTMTGAIAVKAHPMKTSSATISFGICQEFEVAFHKPDIKKAKLIVWGRTVGLLRSSCSCEAKGGSAEISAPGHASIHCGSTELLALTMPARSACCGQSVSVADREGPVWVPVVAGKYSLHQSFSISATHTKGFLCNKPVSAEFAPGESLASDWLGKRDPFHGAAKEDFGFQVIVKIIADGE